MVSVVCLAPPWPPSLLPLFSSSPAPPLGFPFAYETTNCYCMTWSKVSSNTRRSSSFVILWSPDFLPSSNSKFRSASSLFPSQIKVKQHVRTVFTDNIWDSWVTVDKTLLLKGVHQVAEVSDATLSVGGEQARVGDRNARFIYSIATAYQPQAVFQIRKFVVHGQRPHKAGAARLNTVS
jgi:hypothetical protein